MGGGSKRGGRKQIQSFKFECLKWPILAKSGINFHFLCQQGGDIPPVVLRGGPNPPLAETLEVSLWIIIYNNFRCLSWDFNLGWPGQLS